MSEFYSPLRYPGGKSRLANFLIQVLKDLSLQSPTYVEPYAGGAGAALRLLFEGYVDSIVINDLDPRVRCFWHSVTHRTDRFLEMLAEVPVTVEEWRHQRRVYEQANVATPIKLGFATFFLNRTTRSGIVHNGGPIGGYEQNGNFLIDARFNRKKLADRIQRIGLYSDRIEVSGIDGLKLLQTINRRRKEAQNTLVYLDPPYFDKGSKLYKNDLQELDHQRLAMWLSKPRHFPWVMTYDDHRRVSELYASARLRRFGLSYTAHKRRDGVELLISPKDGADISRSAIKQLPCAIG